MTESNTLLNKSQFDSGCSDGRTLDPAIAAVHKWEQADQAMRYADNHHPERAEDDSRSVALDQAQEDAYHRMARTKPQSLEGLALMVRAWAFDRFAELRDLELERPETWTDELPVYRDGRDLVMLKTMLEPIKR